LAPNWNRVVHLDVLRCCMRMSPDGAKYLKRIYDLVESGTLPEGSFSRLVYDGHQLLYADRPDVEEWKCVHCLRTWAGLGECGCAAPEIYQTNHLSTAWWQCTGCGFRWNSESGERCPKCEKCLHLWGDTECSYCGHDKDDYMETLPPGRRPGCWVPGYYKNKALEQSVQGEGP